MTSDFFATLLGGALTLVGGFLGVWYTQHAQRKSHREDIQRSVLIDLQDTLEEYMRVTHDLDFWRKSILERSKDEDDRHIDDIKKQIDKAYRLVRLCSRVEDLSIHKRVNDLLALGVLVNKEPVMEQLDNVNMKINLEIGRFLTGCSRRCRE